jgi:steroid Delta-isomerase
VTALDTREAVARAVAFYEALTPDDVDRIGDVYTPDALFRDPFNNVRGVAAIRRIFADMFERLADCKFTILATVVDEGGALLTWDMTFRMRSYKSEAVQTIHGASHLKFDASGRIAYHRDYWDAADELYAKLPLIGPVMRYLKRRLA